MKKIYYYLLAALTMGLSACQKQPIVPLNPLTKTATMEFTLAPADYQLLPNTTYPYTSYSFNSITDADLYIPMILNVKESAQLNNGSTAAVTYTIAPASLKVADSLYSDVTYTVTKADYKAVTGNTYGDFSAADVLNFLAYKYPTPVANQLAVISYTLYTGTDNSVVTSFLYLNGAWVKIYQVTPAQYTATGEGKYDQFQASDLSKLAGYFNFFLKNDITIADTARANDVEYVSYAYYANSIAYQKVLALTYDGNNWGAISTTATGSFLKSNGTWAAVLPVPTVNHTLTKADITLIAASTTTGASSSLLSNLGQYGDFETSWTPAELDAAFILVLTADYPTPKTGTNYVITYLLYTGGADVPTQLTFQWSGTAWAAH
jgi:hypothetical protein